MMEFFWERTRRILLVRYALALSVENLDRLDERLKAFFDREGLMDTIIDFTAVPSGRAEMNAVVDRAERASRGPASPTRRIFVVDGPLQYGIMRTYGAYQEVRIGLEVRGPEDHERWSRAPPGKDYRAPVYATRASAASNSCRKSSSTK